ncbi:MAG: phosphodiester glycosidase family protein [Verrucomicrobiota bacterium]
MPLLRALFANLLLLLFGYALEAAESFTPVSFHEIEVEVASGSSCKLSLMRFDTSEVDLKIISNGSEFKNPAYGSLQEALQRNGCLAGSNGGFFDTDPFSAVGYLVIDSQVVAERPDKQWMHGLVLVEGGNLSLGNIDELLQKNIPQAALQSGPRLVRAGEPEPDLHDPRRAWRTFIGRDSNQNWILGIASAVSLKDLSQALLSHEMKQVIELDYVLNLDGGSSTGLYLETDGAKKFHREPSRVQNFIGIAPRIKNGS